MIDVKAVCAEWERLGGECWRGPTTHLLGEEQEDEDEVAAELWPDIVTTYPVPMEGAGTMYKATAEVLAALPALAKAWGVTKAPEVLTWGEAVALWVSWGGRNAGSSLRGEGSYPKVLRFEGDEVSWLNSRGRDADITLTADTLEDMAEACELPRTPGRWEAECAASASTALPPRDVPWVRRAVEAAPVVDQHAEAHAEYEARMSAFMGER